MFLKHSYAVRHWHFKYSLHTLSWCKLHKFQFMLSQLWARVIFADVERRACLEMILLVTLKSAGHLMVQVKTEPWGI